jgi:CRISPR/Cas system-associated exonuclease Cas4 (RecB family)
MFPVDPKVSNVLEAIDTGYQKQDRGEARQYIGASMAGTDCVAQLALSLRGFPDVSIDPQLQRIFFAGHKIEDWVLYDLRKRADLRVWEKDDMTGRQHRREWLNGHVVCNADGIVDFEDGTGQAILEVKSMNDNNFGNFKRNGVKSSHRKYYRQMTMMMAMFQIEQSFFIAYNKNNSEYHAQLVTFDQEEWDEMYVKIQSALEGQAGRVASVPNDWRCKSCFKRESCWSQEVDVNPACHFCKHSFANQNGGWTCNLTNKETTDPCDKYVQFRPEPRV